MPIKKKYVRKQRSFKRRPTVKKLAKKVNRILRQIEPKYWSIAGIGALPTNTGSLAIRPYGPITQGTGDAGTRVGDELSCKFINLKMTVILNAMVPCTVLRRVAIVYNQNPDSIVTPAVTIANLYLESAYMAGVNAVNTHKDHDNATAFATLYDQKRTINPNGDGSTTSSIPWHVGLKIPERYQQVQCPE